MPTQRLSMRRIREVLRLRHQGLTERHRGRDRGEQWRRAWLPAASSACGADLAAARWDGRRGAGATAVPSADGGLAKRPATGTRLDLRGEGVAPPQRDTLAVVGLSLIHISEPT